MLSTPMNLSSGYDFARAIWLPERREPVTLFLASGEKVPGRVVERDGDSVLIAILIPVEHHRDDLTGIVLEHANPCGRVRLTGRVSIVEAQGGLLVRLDSPHLLEAVQQREYVRVDVELPVRVGTAAGCLETHTVDVSVGGLLLIGPVDLAVGDTTQLELEIVPGALPVVGTVRVVRFDTKGRAAVAFVSINDCDRWRLLRFTLDARESRRARLDGRASK